MKTSKQKIAIRVLPADGSRIAPVDRTVKISNWKSADDPCGNVLIRIGCMTGKRIVDRDSFLLTPGQAYILNNALKEYFAFNGKRTQGDLIGVVCIADRPSD